MLRYTRRCYGSSFKSRKATRRSKGKHALRKACNGVPDDATTTAAVRKKKTTKAGDTDTDVACIEKSGTWFSGHICMSSSWSSTVISAELTGFETPVWLLNMVAASLSSPFNVPQPYPTPVNAELAPRVPECNSRPYIHVAGRWITQCKSTQDRTKRQREQQRTTCKRSILPRCRPPPPLC